MGWSELTHCATKPLEGRGYVRSSQYYSNEERTECWVKVQMSGLRGRHPLRSLGVPSIATIVIYQVSARSPSYDTKFRRRWNIPNKEDGSVCEKGALSGGREAAALLCGE